MIEAAIRRSWLEVTDSRQKHARFALRVFVQSGISALPPKFAALAVNAGAQQAIESTKPVFRFWQ
jgi:hypothetical protein